MNMGFGMPGGGPGGTMMGNGIPMVLPAPMPESVPLDTPPGLEYLLPTHQIIIEQQMEWGEIMLGIHTNNRYHIMDAWGRRMFFAAENSDKLSLVCLGDCRPWNINIFDSMGQLVLKGTRESGCCGLCFNTIQVMSSTGIVLGGVVQDNEVLSACWNITDERGAPILRLQGPACSLCCPNMATCVEAEFPLVTLQGGQQVGKIIKFFGGMAREMMTAADRFGVEFPVDLNVKIKAVLIYATFMIDFMFYEQLANNNRHRRRYGYY